MTDEAMSPLRRRMIEDMTIRKLAPNTQQGYIRTIKDFAAFLGRSPDTASFEDVRPFQLHLAANGAHVPILNHAVAALRFFFRVTLRRSDIIEHTTFIHEPCPCRKLNLAGNCHRIGRCSCLMREVCSLIWLALIGAFRSRVSLEAENTILRHQLNVLRRKSPKRPTFGMLDRLIFAGLYRLAPKVLDALAIVKPETVIKWHRAGFRSYWRWKSRPRSGRPTVAVEIRRLIREMSIANPLWGAPRIHGELLKLGIEIGQTSVAKYMAKRREPQSQGWRTFLRNHADGIAAMDLFVVPTISFRLLYGLLIVGHGRREILWFGVTAHPTAEWIANQITEACGWEQAPRYLIRDRDGAYGEVFIRRLRSIGIRDRPTQPRSPWQNGYAERLIGSIRQECLDHVVVFGERHLRHVLLSYMSYHNEIRTHLSLEKDAPISRAVELAGHILCRPILGGLHHQYVRI